MVPHPAYSPHLFASDYRLFMLLANIFNCQDFSVSGEVKKWLDDYFAAKSNSFFKDGLSGLQYRWRKNIAPNGDYFNDD